MIKMQKMTPEVYYNTSRDFQLFGRLYEVVFNYVKNNTEGIRDMSSGVNPNQRILELMCNTLGFKTVHQYDNKQLGALCSIFLKCVKSKGTAKSVLLLLKMVCCVEGSLSEPKIVYGWEDNKLNIIIPSDVQDLTLIRDVLKYIMPAGTSYVLVSQTIENYDKTRSELDVDSNVEAEAKWSPISQSIITMSNKQTGNTSNVSNILNPDAGLPYQTTLTVKDAEEAKDISRKLAEELNRREDVNNE